MKSNFAVLALLAARPRGRASFEEIERDVNADAICIQGGPLPDEEALDDVELFKVGLVTPDGDGLRITDTGRSALNALRELRQASPHTIDAKSWRDDQVSLVFRPTSVNEPPPFGSGAEARSDIRAVKGSLFPTVAAAFRRLWRKHLEHDLPDRKIEYRRRNTIGVVIALLSLVLLAICAGAAAVVMQFRSMKSEISYLQREVFSLRQQLLRIDQGERARQIEERANAERTKSGDNPALEAPLSLTREEIQLIRDYIKPAPSAGPATAPVNVGDPIAWPVIPLPSAITEKAPRLLGARFAIRSGVIIIVKKDGHRADAVLGPN